MPLNSDQVNLVLQTGLYNTFQSYKFASEYNNILQLHMSKRAYKRAMTEFEIISSSRTRRPRSIPEDQIVEEAKIMLGVIGEELNSCELAEILNLNVMDVERALHNAATKELREVKESDLITKDTEDANSTVKFNI